MNEAVRFFSLLGVTGLAAWQGRHTPVLLWYFCAHLVYEIGTEPFLLARGDMSLTYAAVYAVLTGVWLVPTMVIAWESLYTRLYRLRLMAIGFVLSASLGRLCVAGLGHPATFADWILIIEGTVLIWAGSVLSMVAAYSERQDLTIVLAALWLIQGGYFFGYVLHLPEIAWIKSGWNFPTLLCIAGFGAVSWRLHVHLCRLRRRYS